MTILNETKLQYSHLFISIHTVNEVKRLLTIKCLRYHRMPKGVVTLGVSCPGEKALPWEEKKYCCLEGQSLTKGEGKSYSEGNKHFLWKIIP